MIVTEQQLKLLKEEFIKYGKKIDGSVMDDPVLSPYPFIYFTDTRDPAPDEQTYTGYPGLIYFWWNTVSTDFFICTNCNTPGDLVWEKIATSRNILGIVNVAGWNINTERAYVQRSSPAFATAYTPSTTNDTFVVASFGLSGTLLSPVSLTVAVGGITIATVGLSGVTATETAASSFIVPPNSTYEFTVVSGSPTIVSVYELSQ